MGKKKTTIKLSHALSNKINYYKLYPKESKESVVARALKKLERMR